MPDECFRNCETKKFRLKIVIWPVISIIFFRYQKISGKQKGSFTKLFVSVLWDKKFRQNCDAPSYAWKWSEKDIFWNTKVLSNEKFWYSETKISTENRDDPPSYAWILSIKKFSQTPKCSPMKYFDTVRQKLRRNIVMTPPPRLLCMKIIEKRIFLKHQSVLQWNFLVQ